MISTLQLRSLVLPSIVKFIAPMFIIVGVVLLTLSAVFKQPLTIDEDVGSQATRLRGLHEPEQNAGFSYAYSRGDTFLPLASAERGPFVAEVRMGGPHEPVRAYLLAQARVSDLGSVHSVRMYHALIPSEPDGSFNVRIQSATVQRPGDVRQLGVLLDTVRLQSAASNPLPVILLITLPLTLICMWTIVMQLGIAYGWKLVIILGVTIGLCLAYGGGDAALIAQSGWVVCAAALILLVITLDRAEYYTYFAPSQSIMVAFVVWRSVLWIVAGSAIWYSNTVYQLGTSLTTFGKPGSRAHLAFQTMVYAWAQWDTGYYRAIAVDGYNTTDTYPRIAFFPLFPALIRIVQPLIGGDALIAAIMVANVALFVAVLLLYDLAQRDFGHRVAYRSVVFLLIFPTSFFFVSGYSESLGLALLCGALWAIQRQRWWMAGIAGFFLALSRLPGIMLALILAVAYLREHHWQWRSVKRLPFLAVTLPPAGLGCFILYQWLRFDEPLAFLRAQAAWDNHFRMPWGTPYEIITTLPTSSDWPLRVLQLIIWVTFIGLTIYTLRRLPFVYSSTMVLFLTPPYFSTWNESLPRYVLMAFPAFIALSLSVNPFWLRLLLLGTMVSLLATCTMLFVNTFWIA